MVEPNMFGEDVETQEFEPLTFGHHKVKVKLAEKDGEPWIKETPKGPRAMLKLYLEDSPHISSLDGVTFNLNTLRGPQRDDGGPSGSVIKSMNQAMGFTAGDLNALAMDGITETDCPVAFVHKVLAMWESSEGVWVEILPEGQYTRTKYLRREPGVKKGIADYAAQDVPAI